MANNAVPGSRKINGKVLSGDVSLGAGDVGACRAYNGSISIGGEGTWTTDEFIAWLKQNGAFDVSYWVCRGSWSYASNRIITDTNCGNIFLAGAVIEVMGAEYAMTIRITTPTTTNGHGIPNAQFTYINNGKGYYPGWRRDYNTKNKPSVDELGLVETVNKANNAVPGSRKVNGKVLSEDISLSAGDVGALPISSALSARVGKLSVNNASNWPGIEFEAANKRIIGIEGTSATRLTIYANDENRNRRFTIITQEKNGTLATLDDINVPVGVPLPYPSRDTPAGYLMCNGQTFNKSQYPQLATAYPSGVLPDLRGEFIRGWDDGRGVDSGRGILSWQGDAIRNITGSMLFKEMVAGVQSAGVFNELRDYTDRTYHEDGGGYTSTVYFDASRVVPTANENRPRNIAFNYIVRAA
ncbi:phage tail protein [Photorhabdus sp. RM323S]|uniref:phage tail protein n=1 Tax=Photorhabdus sp. RM323S TaxID=3342828 RepID=UPI0036DAAEBE